MDPLAAAAFGEDTADDFVNPHATRLTTRNAEEEAPLRAPLRRSDLGSFT